MTRRDRLIHGALLAGFFLVYAAFASAQISCAKIADNRAHVCWSHDGKNTDGTTATGLTFEVEVQAGSTWTKVATGLTSSARDWTSGVLAPGSYTYRVIAFTTVYSDPLVASTPKVVPVPQPNPPGGAVVAQVTVEIAAPAFRIIGRYPYARKGDFVGLVPVGRDCTGPVLFRSKGYGFRAVVLKPAEAWQTDGPAPAVAAAPCVRIGA